MIAEQWRIIARTMVMHPNSLANLRSWEPGQSGNPAGRKPAGLSLLEWINVMHTKTEADVQKIADDESEPVVKRVAAKAWLGALSSGWFKGKREGADDLDRILDRTIGKPVQSMLIQHTQPDDPVVLAEQLRQILSQSPELCALMSGLVGAGALPPADEPADSAE